MAPDKPSISHKLYILRVIQDGDIELPKARTRRSDIRDRGREQNTTMIRKRTTIDRTRGNRGYPRKRNAKKINTRGKTAIPPGPGEAWGGGVQVPPDVSHAARLE